MRNAWLVVVLACGLAGCATQAELAVRDRATCEGFGFEPGTTPYANCLMSQSQQRDQALRDFIRDQRAASDRAMQNARPVYCNQTLTGYVCN
ncbi:hypothetical protein FH063_001357 [Azospirillum argentinense]|uniref:Lipoprotein n=1 Tax=Azospirillum argentinense TaxID=2970906 RepID=A0A5B0KYK3_9PROT|nr:hypothetical protein FH063_001357 [Azospirillum argentinense]